MTCEYTERFAGPKRCRTIQAVMVAAFMSGIAVGLAQRSWGRPRLSDTR